MTRNNNLQPGRQLGVVVLVIVALFLLIFSIRISEIDIKKVIGYTSGILVFLSGLIYMVRVYQRKVTPNLVTWGLFALMGIAILLSYKSSGAKDSVWPAMSGAVNPTVILIITLFRKHSASFSKLDFICGILGLTSIIFWYFTNSIPKLVQYALYMALLADFIAIIPTIKWVYKNPNEDRPAMWLLFSFGYGLGILAIKDHTFTNYVLPVFMLIFASPVWILLVRYRIKQRIHIREWI